MFNELSAKLGSIDAVLNEEEMNSRNAFDRKQGFDPFKDYAPEELKELKKLGLSSLEVFMKLGGESRYLLLEVKLEDQDSKFTKHYLRGFDIPINSHPVIAERFLRKELQPAVTPPFELPEDWPYDSKRFRDRYDRAIEREFAKLKLTVTAIGGGKFDLSNSRINLKGQSEAFGPIPQPYQDKLKELLGQLIQRQPYNCFQINFE